MRSLLCLAVLAALAGCGKKSRPEPIWIGHVAPLSGPDARRGEESIRAIQAALEKAREDDFTVAGRAVGVRHVDSAGGKGRAEAVRLLAVNRVSALVVGPGVAEVPEILAAARSHSAPVVVLCESTQPADPTSVFPLGLDPASRGAALAGYATGTARAASVVSIVDPDCPVCSAVADAFAKAWRKGKSGPQTVTPADLDRDPAVRKRLESEPPDVFLAAVPYARLGDPKSALSVLVRKRPTLFGGEGHEPTDPEVWSGRKHPTLVWAAPSPDRDQPIVLALEKGAEGRLTTDTVVAVDAIRFLLRGLSEAESPERGRLFGALRGIEGFDGTAGPVVWRDGRPVRPLSLMAAGKVVGRHPAKD